ncbi:MAG TPA: MFS transporter [Synergistaceae bacterium]|nr:MFS transporter [Synergistaceae bacterium]HPQ36532.1 MFS transporter [Synergistaceae bacterium]
MKWRAILAHPRLRGWVFYDVGNSAFATTIMVVLYPLFYQNVLSAGMDVSRTTAYWGYASALGLLLAALGGPFAGALGDASGKRKLGLGVMTALGIGATAAMAFLREGQWMPGLLLLILGSGGFALANVFYDSLLTRLAAPWRIPAISSAGYAFGYLGGGVLLVCNGFMVFLLPSWGFRLSFLSVALWWGLFSLPLFRNVPEPPGERVESLGEAMKRPLETLREIRKKPETLRFLLAFWLYNDGIGTIMKMGVLFGSAIGVPPLYLVTALILTQFVGIPSTLAWGALARSRGLKKSLVLTLVGYAIIALGVYFVHTPWHFAFLAVSVGLFQGGAQALSRALFSRLIPPEKTAEFFGFYDMSSKFAGVAGPFLFGLLTQITGSVRAGIPVLVFFFIGGILLLRKVPERRPLSS